MWISPIQIKYLQQSEHLYIDATYISTKEYYQTLIVMGYNSHLNLKVPCCFILMNNKSQTSYEISLSSLYNIITEYHNNSLNIISICTDFEEALINAVKLVFKNIRNVGCLFHYIKNIRLNMQKIGLLKDEIKNNSETLLNLFEFVAITATLTFSFFYFEQNAEKLKN